MFHMPMSSPMTTTMFGCFAGAGAGACACACAVRGTATAAISNNPEANAPSFSRVGCIIAAQSPVVGKFDPQIAGYVRGTIDRALCSFGRNADRSDPRCLAQHQSAQHQSAQHQSMEAQ